MSSHSLWASHIDDDLYLGDIYSVKNLPNYVTHVLSILSEKPRLPKGHIELKHLFIQAVDEESQDLLSIFAVCYRFIREALEKDPKNTVLIHCRAGRSRSATITLMYLMRTYQMTYNGALKYLLQRRPLVKVNKGFEKQLQAFERSLQKCKWDHKCTCTICVSEFGSFKPKAPIKMANQPMRKSSSYEDVSSLRPSKIERSPSFEFDYPTPPQRMNTPDPKSRYRQGSPRCDCYESTVDKIHTKLISGTYIYERQIRNNTQESQKIVSSVRLWRFTERYRRNIF